MVSSPAVNKILRRDFSPTLKRCGFQQIQTRHNWGWHGPCTWVLDIRSVGSHFARVTGWPPQSFSVSLGVFYDFVPLGLPREIKHGANGELLPLDVDCHQRSVLHTGLNQRQHTQHLSNSAEQSRTDLWWVEPDGNNVEVVVQDLIQRFLDEGVPWFERMTDIPTSYNDMQKEHDCLHKYSRAAYLAKFLQREAEYQDYRIKLDNEALRIGGAALFAMYP